MSELIEKIKNEIRAFEEKKKTLVEELRKEFPQLIKPILEQSQKIDSISWTQYTPYFNDGEECIFGVHRDIGINDSLYDEPSFLERYIWKKILTEEDKIENNKAAEKFNISWYKNRKIGEDGIGFNPEFDENEHNIVTQIEEILEEIPDDFFKDLFGDHVKVTITKDGQIEVEEYEHE